MNTNNNPFCGCGCGHSNTKADLEQKVEEWIQEAFEEGMRVGKFWKDKETR